MAVSTRVRVPDVNIRLNGADLPLDARTDIRSVTVLEDLNALSMFTLVLHNFDQRTGSASWSDSSLFALGAEVQIELGYIGELRQVITGQITSLEPAFTPDEPPTLTVRGYDYRHWLARGRTTRTFVQMTDSDIVTQVAGRAGLSVRAQNTRTVLDYVVQHNQTDLEFLQRRAGLIGYELFVRDRVLYFQPPQHGGRAVATLRVGGGITEFIPQLRTLRQVDEMIVRGWDLRRKEPIVGVAAAGGESARMGGKSGPQRTKQVFGAACSTSVDVPVQSQESADRMVQGRFDEMALTYIQGEVECEGNPLLRVGTVVDIQGAGEVFSGDYYLISASHTISVSGGYRTRLDVRRNAA